ncbi:hypothetical protein LEP1GSC083_1956 [Leptospira interrogans serovar Pyrogenes str. L0374]|uniref:Uncharacterized protein n=1 Tax=Leptospira interrogans serovar Pyrogenes str. L0374 TaxID=1049928 RepID=M6KLE1_LEPIR|nr:hypothetical protein LEP1GSC083_1956 [Leptospira interrogans serovar Pyrogenes str. L0374]
MAHEQEDIQPISNDSLKPEPKYKILVYSLSWFLLSALSFFLGIHLLKKGDSALSNENFRSSSIGIVDEIRKFFSQSENYKLI